MRYVVPGLLGVCLCTAVILFGAVELRDSIYVYALAWLLALIWAGKLFFAKSAFWKPSPMHWPVLGFVAYTALHYFLSPYEYLSRMELFQVALYGLVYFIVANNINHGRERTVVVGILVVLGTLEAMYGMWQAYTKHEFVMTAYRPTGYLPRGSGTYICPNHLAGLLEMILGFALARLALHRTGDNNSIEAQVLSKVMLAYAVLAIMAGILFSLSRGGWFATIVGFLMFLLWGGLKSQRVWRRISVAAAALCVFGLLLFNVPKLKYYISVNTLTKTKDKNAITLKDPGLSSRTVLWGATWKMIQDHPVLGTGAGTWQWVHQKYRHPMMQFDADYAHNDILQMISDYGIVGLALVLATLGCFYWQAVRLRFHGISSEQRCFAAGAALAVSILLIHSWFDFNLHIPANGLLFSTILGLVAGMEIPEGPYVPRSLKGVWRYMLGSFLILVVAAGIYFVLPAALSTHYTELGASKKRYLQWNEAIRCFQRAIQYDPKYTRPRVKLADVYRTQAEYRIGEDKKAERVGLAQEAIKHYKAAYMLNRSRSDTILRLARAYELAGELENARQALDEAVVVDPRSTEVYLQLGLYLRRRGQEAEALRAFETSHKLTPTVLGNLHLAELRATARDD